MNFFKKSTFAALLLMTGLLAGFVMLPTHAAHAQADIGTLGGIAAGAGASAAGAGSGIVSEIAGTVISKVTFGISYLISGVFAIAVVVEAWLIAVMLSMNDTIFQSAFVQNGFSVSLALANLLFVLGIIIIAISTILRNESYGIKKLLWKLVVAAILVNFGLVIAAPIFGFGNSLTHYFLNCINPASGGCTQSSSGFSSYNDFATTLAGSFQPQNSFSVLDNSASGSANNVATKTYYCTDGSQPDANNMCGTGLTQTFALVKAVNTPTQDNVSGAFSALGSNFGKMLVPVFGMVFVLINMLLITTVLGALIVLLLIRYLYIAILAVLMPFAWASWAFPGFGSHWSKWWNKFIRWTFFAPIIMFFVYLSLLLMKTSQAGGGVNFSSYQSGSIYGPLASFLGGLFSPIIMSFVQEIIFAGLIIGGMVAADSLGIKFAGTVMNQVKTAKNAVTGYAGRKAKEKTGRMVPRQLKENLQSGKYRLVPKRLQVAAGVGLENLERTGRAESVSREAKEAETVAKNPQQFARILAGKPGSFGLGQASKERHMAMLAQLAKDDNLLKEVNKQGGVVGGKGIQEYLRDNEAEFKRLQQVGTFETLKDKTGLTPLELAKKNEEPSKTVLELGGKYRLNQMRDLLRAESDPAKLAALSKDEKKQLSDYHQEKTRLEAGASTMGGALPKDEQAKLAEMQKMESTIGGGDYIDPAEKEKYEKARVEFEENTNKIKAWVAKNPDLAADLFQNHDAARAKVEAERNKPENKGKLIPMPLTLEPDSVKQMQKALLTAVAEGFSPQNVKNLIEAVGKKNNLKYFEGAMNGLDENTQAQIRELAKSNEQLATMIRNNPGRLIIDLNKMFGIEGKKYDKKKGEDDEE